MNFHPTLVVTALKLKNDCVPLVFAAVMSSLCKAVALSGIIFFSSCSDQRSKKPSTELEIARKDAYVVARMVESFYKEENRMPKSPAELKEKYLGNVGGMDYAEKADGWLFSGEANSEVIGEKRVGGGGDVEVVFKIDSKFKVIESAEQPLRSNH